MEKRETGKRKDYRREGNRKKKRLWKGKKQEKEKIMEGKETGKRKDYGREGNRKKKRLWKGRKQEKEKIMEGKETGKRIKPMRSFILKEEYESV